MIEPIIRGLPVQPLLDAIDPEWWTDITARQSFPGSAHGDTRTIYLRGPKSFLDYFDTSAQDYPRLAGLIPVILPILRPVFAFTHVQRWHIGRILLVSLKPGGHVTEHVDEGAYADAFSRYHVVLSTNDACWYRCGDVVASYPAGTAFWFDHHLPHEAHNGGETERVHLIVDVMKHGRNDETDSGRPTGGQDAAG